MTKSAATTVSECPGHIVYQSGYCIFGSGRTLEDAIADAQQWVDPKGSLEAGEIRMGGNGETDGQFYWAPATQRLLIRIDDEGGQAGYHINENGVADAE